MQAVTDALRLLANVVMAWTTAQMPNSLERWANRWHIVPVELIGRIASTRLKGINLRCAFRFPIERYAALTPAVTIGGQNKRCGLKSTYSPRPFAMHPGPNRTWFLIRYLPAYLGATAGVA
jgi:hypothetical protein